MEPSDTPSSKEPEDGPVISVTGFGDAAEPAGGGSDAGGGVDVSGGVDVAGGADVAGGVDVAGGADVAGGVDVGGGVDGAAGMAARSDGEGETAPVPPPALVVLPASALPGSALTVQAPREPWSPSLAFMGVSAFIVAALDLGSKEWATRALAGPDLKRTMNRIEAIPGHLDFIFAQNPGGAWSFLRSMPDGLRRPFFLFVSAAAIVFIVSVYRRLDRRQWAMRWGLPLALGGAIGNLADRVRYGWVVDFIDFYVKRAGGDFHWPTFNVADVAIVFGVGLMAIDLFSLRKMSGPEGAPSPETASGAA